MMDKERKAALDAFDNVIKNCWSSISLYMSRADIPVIRASLATSPAPMPKEVAEAVEMVTRDLKIFNKNINPSYAVVSRVAIHKLTKIWESAIEQERIMEEEYNNLHSEAVSLRTALVKALNAMHEDFGNPDDSEGFTGSVAAGETMAITFELMREMQQVLTQPGEKS